MIVLTRKDGSQFYLNPELIQTVEETPDTVITLMNQKKLIVRDSAQVIAAQFIEYKHRILLPYVEPHSQRNMAN